MQQTDSIRLATNQKTLLETIPDMVLLVRADGSVEYMNPQAVNFFANCKTPLDKEDLKKKLKTVLTAILQAEDVHKIVCCTIQHHSFNCHLAPFTGYNGDNMHWMVLKQSMDESSTISTKTRHPFSDKDIIGSSEVISTLKEKIKMVAKVDAPVLITGESGTGKELFANLLYHYSDRHKQPFLTINCSAINDSILESELFGYEKGAFSGAYTQTKGKFEAVDGGTIFLDEIGDISQRMQSVLLRVIQYGEIIRVGGNIPIKVNVRIIAATNRNLADDVRNGKFRLDLFYRLNIINVTTPSLRERGEDIIELANYFTEKYSNVFKRPVTLEESCVDEKLKAYHWPGNVRELENVIQRAILMSNSEKISADMISFDMPMENQADNNAEEISSYIHKFNGSPLKGIVEEVEREVIMFRLSQNNGNVTTAAEELNISKAALYEKMKRHSISAKSIRWTS